jgi:hypothetical protein
MEMARGGAVCVYLVNDSEYLQHGVVRSLCLIGLDGLAQDGGAVWTSSAVVILMEGSTRSMPRSLS